MTYSPIPPRRRGPRRLWFVDHPLFYFVGVLVALVVVLVSLSILRHSSEVQTPPRSGVTMTTGADPASPTSPTSPASPATGSAAATSSAATMTAGLGIDPSSRLRLVAESALPAQARTTLAAIRAGGPYQYPANDDVVFGNREGLLPAEAAGFYREYTVVTPGSPDRGPRRIIRGSDGALYYTADHYSTFQRIKVDR